MSTFISDMDEDARKQLVETWMNDDLVKRQFNLECLSDEETPVEAVEEKVSVPEKKEKIPEKKEKKKTPVKEKSPAEKGKKFDPVKFLKANPDTPIKCIPENPKKPGTASYDFYEGYKNATTLKEFMDSGGQNVHIRYDFSKGFIHILDDSVENVVLEQKKKKSTPKKKKSSPNKKKKSSPKKEVEKKVEKVEEKKEDIDLWGDKDESDDEEVAFKPLSEVTTDEDIEEDDDEWPTETIDGVEYSYNISDKILIDKVSAEQIGYLDDDGTIDFIGNGEDVHEKNKGNL
jgi:hypothetical protein